MENTENKEHNTAGEILELKVKADDENIDRETKKQNSKKLAGAISHALRASGAVNVRCFGSASIGKGVKSLAIARDYISKNVPENVKLDLYFSPAFITTQMGENELTGLCFWTFSNVSDGSVRSDPENCKIILKVKADDHEASQEEKKVSVKKLTSAVTHALKEEKEVVLRCFGNAAISKGAKALAIARGQVAVRGPDMYAYAKFIVSEINGANKTGICFYAYTNEM